MAKVFPNRKLRAKRRDTYQQRRWAKENSQRPIPININNSFQVRRLRYKAKNARQDLLSNKKTKSW